jgi:MtN3 and saliva related transmembrane protein
MSELVVNTVGTLAALCTIVSFMPQIAKIIRERDASSVSLKMYIFTVAAFTLWTAYGIFLEAWPVVAANVISLLIAAVTLGCKWKFRDGASGAQPAKAR